MKLTLNPEYAQRHLFVTVLMIGLAGWFGYDGFVRYPATPADELYRSIEKADPPEGYDLDAFKSQKTKTQYGFCLIALLAGVVVGVRLLKSKRFAFESDAEGFVCCGRRHTYESIRNVDRSRWEAKGIVSFSADGERITLDAWHHQGVKDFEKMLPPSLKVMK